MGMVATDLLVHKPGAARRAAECSGRCLAARVSTKRMRRLETRNLNGVLNETRERQINQSISVF